MIFTRPISEIITDRFSCRQYLNKPIAAARRQELQDYISAIHRGPLGTPVRFSLAAASDGDRQALKGLGTYGTIKSPTGFILGAMGPGSKNLEDYGYRLEQIVLYATGLGLGTCWLGGYFTKSSFARKISLTRQESVPAVISTGLIANEQSARAGIIRRGVGGDARLPWEKLFFDGQFGIELTAGAAGQLSTPLEMLRLGPSASNKQPWRLVKDGNAWHFYLQRTPGYSKSLGFKMLGLEDLQRVDIGIAMCHFELTANELGLVGQWEVQEPSIAKFNRRTEYIITWLEN